MWGGGGAAWGRLDPRKSKLERGQKKKKSYKLIKSVFFFLFTQQIQFNYHDKYKVCVCVRVLLSFDLQLLKNYNLSLSVIRIWENGENILFLI